MLEDDELSDQQVVNRVAEAIDVRDRFAWLGFEHAPDFHYVS